MRVSAPSTGNQEVHHGKAEEAHAVLGLEDVRMSAALAAMRLCLEKDLDREARELRVILESGDGFLADYVDATLEAAAEESRRIKHERVLRAGGS